MIFINRTHLRRITAAPCLLPVGNSYVAKRWARAWPSYWTMCSASRCGNPSGRKRKKKRGRKKERRRRTRRRRRRWPLGSLLGHYCDLLGASWGPLGGLLGASLGLFGPFGGPRVSMAALGLRGPPKIAPRRPQMASRLSWRPPRWSNRPQDGPQSPQDASTTLPRGSKRPQEASKRAPRREDGN